MKNNIKNLAVIVFVFSFFLNRTDAQLYVNSAGNVGLAYQYPSTKLWVEGTTRFSGWTDLIIDWTGNNGTYPTLRPESNYGANLGRSSQGWFAHAWISVMDINNGTYTGQWYNNSDKRIKTNIVIVSDVLSKIKKINVYSYNYNDKFMSSIVDDQKSLMQKKHFGFLAQEFAEIYPNLVNDLDTTQLSIAYVGMIPILTQAIKDQQIMIENLQNDILNLKSNDEKKSTQAIHDQIITGSSLDQNMPNPFNQSTQIGYSLPDAVQKAYINIYNLNGLQILSIPIQIIGRGKIFINASELKPGIYLYSLISDGQEVDTKRMILTE